MEGFIGLGSDHRPIFSSLAFISKSYNSLLLLHNNTKDTLEAKKIARVYIEKSRKDTDSNKMALGYVKMASMSKRRNALKYLDTSITLSKNNSRTF